MQIIYKCCKSAPCGLVIGFLSIIGSTVSITLNSHWLTITDKWIELTVLLIVMSSYVLISACLLIYGLAERKYNCLIPYLVAMFIVCVFTISSIRHALDLLSDDRTIGAMYLIAMLITIIVIIIFSIVIYDHLKRIKNEVLLSVNEI